MTRAVPSCTVLPLAPRRSRNCVVIPVLNEGERFMSQLRGMAEAGIPAIADIVVADGGSRDGSTDEDFLRSCGVSCLLTKTGPGKLSAQLRMAYAWALDQGYEGVVTIDGNGKDSYGDIPRFIEALESGAGYVQASRYAKGGRGVNTPLVRHLAVRFVHSPLTSLGAGTWLTDTTQGFRGYSRDLLADPRLSIFRNIFDTYELLAYISVRAPRLGYRTVEIGTTRTYPAKGKIPTKISAVRGNLILMRSLLSSLLGLYNPKAADGQV